VGFVSLPLFFVIIFCEVFELPNRPANFVESDLRRIFRAARKENIEVVVTLPGGTIVNTAVKDENRIPIDPIDEGEKIIL
jgi:hypothetical protein